MTAKPVSVRIARTISRPQPQSDDAPERGLEPVTPVDAAQYIAALSPGLERLASRYQLTFLAYLLSMVTEEARRLVVTQGSAHTGTDAATR